MIGLLLNNDYSIITEVYLNVCYTFRITFCGSFIVLSTANWSVLCLIVALPWLYGN